MTWEVVIGLETHVQLSTKTKLFSRASTSFGADPNTNVNLVDCGLPGVLPTVNKEAFYKAIRFGLAINATINQTSHFDRKNYFYPDLPKGYQITQMDRPIVEGGQVEIELEGAHKVINVTRAHLEEDAGKSIHDADPTNSLIDLNRAGTPLLEIVSEPEISSAKEAVAYMKALHQLITFLDVSDGNMSQGSMRCDANVSIRKKGDKELGTRTEIKNINSLFVTMFGIGKLPKIPGTFGSLATIIILFIFFHIFNISSNLILLCLIVIFSLSFIAVAAHIKDNENKDPKEVIIDEFIGQSIPIYLYEISHVTEKSLDEAIIFYGVCFILFRFFDIIKPFPVSYFDKNFKNSFGVIMDDVCAGFYVVLSLICFMVLRSYFI